MRIGPEEPDRWDAMEEPMSAMLQTLQDHFKVSPQSIAVVAATVFARNGGPDTMHALKLGVEIGLEKWALIRREKETARREERRRSKLNHNDDAAQSS